MFGAKKLGMKLVEAMRARAQKSHEESKGKDGAERLISLIKAQVLSDVAEAIEVVMLGEKEDG